MCKTWLHDNWCNDPTIYEVNKQLALIKQLLPKETDKNMRNQNFWYSLEASDSSSPSSSAMNTSHTLHFLNKTLISLCTWWDFACEHLCFGRWGKWRCNGIGKHLCWISPAASLLMNSLVGFASENIKWHLSHQTSLIQKSYQPPIWQENILGYLSAGIISSVSFKEQKMSKDKYPSTFFAPNGGYCLFNIVLQTFFTTSRVLNIGEHSRYSPV